MNINYKFKKHYIYILREYKRKTYNELLKHEYPITDLVTIEKDTLSIEIILLEKYRDHLLLGLDVTLLGSKKICCKNSCYQSNRATSNQVAFFMPIWVDDQSHQD